MLSIDKVSVMGLINRVMMDYSINATESVQRDINHLIAISHSKNIPINELLTPSTFSDPLITSLNFLIDKAPPLSFVPSVFESTTEFTDFIILSRFLLVPFERKYYYYLNAFSVLRCFRQYGLSFEGEGTAVLPLNWASFLITTASEVKAHMEDVIKVLYVDMVNNQDSYSLTLKNTIYQVHKLINEGSYTISLTLWSLLKDRFVLIFPKKKKPNFNLLEIKLLNSILTYNSNINR